MKRVSETLFEYCRSRIRIQEDGCWIWLASTNGKGYAKINVKGHDRYVHRALYIEKYGPIPERLELDHLCKRTLCVNPDHMEPVIGQENARRGNNARFSTLVIEEIRSAEGTRMEIAKRFDMSWTHVDRIKKGIR